MHLFYFFSFCMLNYCYAYFLILLFLDLLRGLWDLSSLTTDRTRTTAVKAPNPNHWTIRELPELFRFAKNCFLKN